MAKTLETAVETPPAAGYSDWLAADEVALDYLATRIAPKFGVSDIAAHRHTTP